MNGINHGEQDASDIALELSEIVHSTILEYLNRIFPTQTKHQYSIVYIFPEKINSENDIMNLAGKAQITVESKNYYVPLPSTYYKLYGSIGSTEESKGVLNKLSRLLKKASPKTKGVSVRAIATRVTQSAAGLMKKKHK